MIKQGVSLLLALLIVLSVFTVLPMAASAEEIETDVIESIEADLTDTGASGDTSEELPFISNQTDGNDLVPANNEEEEEEQEQTNYPVITLIENTKEGAKITWDSYGDNTIYRVYYRKAAVYNGTWEEKYGAGTWKRLAQVSGNSYTHTGLEDGEIGVYTVRCVDSKGNFTSEYSKEGWENCFYAAPEIKSIVFDEDGVHIEWDYAWLKHGERSGERYILYRKTSGTGWKRINLDAQSVYTDATADPAEKYTYTLRLINAEGKFISGYTSGKSVEFSAYPYVKKIENTETGVKLTWTNFTGAAKYRVFYKKSGAWTRLALVSGTTYTDTSIKDGETRIYTVRAVDSKENYNSGYYKTGWSIKYFAALALDSLTNTTAGVKLTWKRPADAQMFSVCRKKDDSWIALTQTDGTEYTDTTVVSGKTYTYSLRIINPEDGSALSGMNGGKSIMYVAAPVINSATNVTNGVKLTWSKSAGAEVYRVYYYSGGAWKKIGATSKTEFVDTTVKSGETRKYTVRCLDSDGNFLSDFYREGYTNTYFAPPVIDSLEVTDGGIIVKWTREAGAGDYRVYRKTSGETWTRLTQTDKTSYTDTTAKKNVKYNYTLRIIDREEEVFMSDFLSGKTITACNTPAFTSLTSEGKGTTLKWSAVKNASKYRVYYKNDTGWTRMSTVSGTSCTDTSVKNGQTRVYTIRCVDSDGQFVSDYNREGWSHLYTSPPSFSSIKYSNGAYTLSWKAQDGAASYKIYRMKYGDSDWKAIATGYVGTSYVDNTVVKDSLYKYTLRSMDETGNLISSYISDNPYYKNGTKYSGDVKVNGTTYHLKDGKTANGYLRESGKLRYYKDGKLVSGTVVGTSSEGYYYAGSDGICCESEDMKLAVNFLMKTCKGSSLKERFKYGYLYIAHQFDYERRYTSPDSKDDLSEYAVDMFTNHSGDCYRYAVCVAYIARLAGYRSCVAVGTENASGGDHGWTEVKVNGTWLICDAESEIPSFGYDDYSRYMIEDHPWDVEADWYAEITVSNGKVVWTYL